MHKTLPALLLACACAAAPTAQNHPAAAANRPATLDGLTASIGAHYTDAAQCTIALPEKPQEADPLAVYLSAHRTLAPAALKPHLLTLLQEARRRNCPFDAYNLRGFTALHFAVLGNDAELAAYLLDNGAKPAASVRDKTTAIYGQNALQLLQTVKKSRPDRDYTAIEALLNRHAQP